MPLDILDPQVDIHLLAVSAPQGHLSDAWDPLQRLAHPGVEKLEVGAQIPIGC